MSLLTPIAAIITAVAGLLWINGDVSTDAASALLVVAIVLLALVLVVRVRHHGPRLP